MYKVIEHFHPCFNEDDQTTLIATFKYKWQAVLYKFFFYDIACDPTYMLNFAWKIIYEDKGGL